MSRTLALVLTATVLATILHAQAPRRITFDDIAHPKRGEWPSYNGHLSANRHSPSRFTSSRVGVERGFSIWMLLVRARRGLW